MSPLSLFTRFNLLTLWLHTKPFTEAIRSLLKIFPYCSWLLFDIKDLYDLFFYRFETKLKKVFMGAGITFSTTLIILYLQN